MSNLNCLMHGFDRSNRLKLNVYTLYKPNPIKKRKQNPYLRQHLFFDGMCLHIKMILINLKCLVPYIIYRIIICSVEEI